MASPPNNPPLTFNVPMALTWARIAMIPVIVGIFYVPDAWYPEHWKNATACWLFVVAAVTDAFDGYIARRYGMVSRLGAFLDPVADKLMVCAALIVLLSLGRVDEFVALVIIGREITVSALREWMAQIGKSSSVAVNSLGQDQDHCADGGDPDAAVPRPALRHDRRARDRHAAHLHRCGPHGVLDAGLPAHGVAASQRSLKRHRFDTPSRAAIISLLARE